MVAENKIMHPKFDIKAAEKILWRENNFIKNLFSTLAIPASSLQGLDEDEEPKQFTKFKGSQEKTRATSLTELQDRLKNVQSKKKLNYKEKLLKKGLKNRLKKKSKREERNANKKLVRMQKLSKPDVKSESNLEDEKSVKAAKPIFNKEGKMVFSKFDFSGLGQQKREKRTEKDPKKILINLEKQKAKFSELEEKGEKDKATELKQKIAWKNALAKSEGQKVKDDPLLLKKSIKKRDQLRKGSQKKWSARQEGVKKAQEARQAKRTENLEKRKKEKKHKKIKNAVKKGKVIPGF